MTTISVNPLDEDFLVGLSCFQRLLLVTDGTVTEMLEQYLQEKIQVCKLRETLVENESLHHQGLQYLTDDISKPVLERRILLQGQRTKTNWLYAESLVFLAHLPEAFRRDLLELQEPIGRLWTQHRVETFKEILGFSRCKAHERADYFAISPQVELIVRSYAVYSGGNLIMLISEMFPDHFFCSEAIA